MRPDLMPAPVDLASVVGLVVTGFGTARFEGTEMQMPIEFNEAAPAGPLDADGRLSSVETGATLIERLIERGARFVRRYAEQAA